MIDWTSNSVDPDETEPSHLNLCCLQKPNIIAYGSERVNIRIAEEVKKADENVEK